MESKTSNMSDICGGTSGRLRLTHDQCNDGKDNAYLRDKGKKKKLGRVNLFFKLTSLWFKIKKNNIKQKHQY